LSSRKSASAEDDDDEDEEDDEDVTEAVPVTEAEEDSEAPVRWAAAAELESSRPASSNMLGDREATDGTGPNL